MLTLPRLDVNSNPVSERNSGTYSTTNKKKPKKQNNRGAKSIDQNRMATIPLESFADDNTTQAAMTNVPTQMRESADETMSFDTKKWKKIINANVDMVQKKVD